MMKFFNSMSCFYTMVNDFLHDENFFLHIQKYFDTMKNNFHMTKTFCYLHYEKGFVRCIIKNIFHPMTDIFAT